MTTTELYEKTIVYDRETHDYAMYLDGELAGFARTYHEADTTLDALIAELTNDPADVPTDGPSTDEPGGPGGEPPPDDAVHAARIVARLALYTDTAWQAAAYASSLPATPAAVTSRAPERQDSGPSWRAKQAWAQSEARRRRGLAHPEVQQ